MTLNNLAILYSDTQRMKEAEEAYQRGALHFAANSRKPTPRPTFPMSPRR